MTMLQALLIAVLQGASELFPVSSLGHAVVLPAVLGWRIDEQGTIFLPFLVLLHLGTAAALLGYFWRDWLALGLGVVGLAESGRVAQCRRMVWLIVLATLPAVVIGGLGEHMLRRLFSAPTLVAGFLVMNGVLLAVCERMRRSTGKALPELSARDAVTIGLWQCLALIPGLSRSGATIVGGLRQGLDHENAAHFSFLIALPIIIGATVLEVPKLLADTVAPGVWRMAVIAAVVAGAVAWLSTAFLMRYFRNDETGSLNPFAWYCIVAGLAALVWLNRQVFLAG